MTTENEQSLQKRPELVPERLMRGGLIVGVEPGIQGSLMSVTGAAIERITREKTEVPPQFKLPERPVYFLDPNTRRLIMISNRENRGENKTPDKYGLFAEIVELDEEGKPHYRLSSSEIILPDDNYHLVAVGPNNYGLPPSHLEIVDEGATEFKGGGINRGSEIHETEAEKGKKRFVSWNSWLSNLQNWTNEVRVDPNEDFETFVRKFSESQASGESKVQRIIEAVFPKGEQGIDRKTFPVNMIVTDRDDNLLRKASIDAGFYPMLLDMKNLAKYYDEQLNANTNTLGIVFIIKQYLRSHYDVSPAVITFDEMARQRLIEYLGKPLVNPSEELSTYRELSMLPDLIYKLQQYNPIFSSVLIRDDESTPLEGDDEWDKAYEELARRPIKFKHGYYKSPYDEEQYRGLLNKLKADLLLTMFLRGGAPIVK